MIAKHSGIARTQTTAELQLGTQLFVAQSIRYATIATVDARRKQPEMPA